jgi:hypothetical protein
MQRHSIDSPSLNPFLLGGLFLAFLGLMLDFRSMLPFNASTASPERCQGDVNREVVLSREQLAQLLSVPERDTKQRVQDIVGAPFCSLQSLQVRAGIVAERQVYPLAFDPSTRLVILYEGDEYAGYRFSYQ